MHHHDPHHLQRKAQPGGFTLVELIISAAVLMLLSLIVTQLTITGQAAHRYSTRMGRITEVTQRVLDDIRQDTRAAVRLFGNDPLGLAYRARLAPWFGYDPIASSRLPVIQPSQGIRRDAAGAENTGNELLLARHGWTDTFECLSGKSYRVDVFRIEWVYLRLEGSQPGVPEGALNVCSWTSEPLASATQIDLIADATDRQEVLRHLLDGSPDATGKEHDPVAVVWRLGEDPDVAGTLRQILSDGTLSDTPEAPRKSEWQIEQSEVHSTPGRLFTTEHSIARNGTPFVHGVSRFAIRDDTAGAGAGFPHGMEFQVVGPSAARKVLVHLTTMSTNRQGLRADFDIQVVINVREG